MNNKNKKIFLISEALSFPFDEGFKNITFSLYNQLVKKENVLSVTKAGNNTGNLKVMKIGLNKLFLNNKLRLLIKNYSPDIILYVPYASCTFNSFLRAKILKLMGKKARVVMLGVQHRGYLTIQDFLITNFLRPDLLFLFGELDKDFFFKRGIKVKVLPPAVDNAKFCPATKDEKERIRAEYNIPLDKKVVLHVGHIGQTRNTECFIDIQKIENIQVVVVGSTSTPRMNLMYTTTDNYLKDKLRGAGVHVIDEFIPDISKIYKMSDIYVFPIPIEFSRRYGAAINIPLSVLEALACNLPVITTRFGALVDYFKEDSGFRYFSTTKELIALIREIDRADVHNSKKIENFTWDRFADEVVTACEELL
jgi:glycosyltransferase involved in cell wall biosynthesis